jgi:hypothetical protein
MKNNKYTLMELLITIGIILTPIIAAIYFLFVNPPINYEDYNKERNKRIEQIQKRINQ